MSLSYARCRMNNCDFKSENKDEKTWDSHYQDQHGTTIRNTCRSCGKRFVAAWRGFTSEQEISDGEDEILLRVICDECSDENPLESLFVEKPEKV